MTSAAVQQDFYRILRVAPSAPPGEIKQALNQELRIWSNRTNAPQLDRRQEAERMVKLLEEAESVLLDPTRRSAYDQQLRNAPPQQPKSFSDSDVAGSTDLVQQGWRLLESGDIANALFVATKATGADGNNSEAWALLAQAKFRWGDTDDSIYEYKRALSLKPNEASYYFDLGNVYESVDKLSDALQQYERASKIEPRAAVYRAAIGLLYLRQDRQKDAIEILERCVAEDPENQGFQRLLAIGYIDSAYDNWTYVPDGKVLPEGRYATERKHVTEAQEFAAKAERLRFDDASLRRHIAEVTTNVNSMLARQFYGSYAAPIFGGIMWSFFFGLGLVFAPLYFYAARPPKFVINKRLLRGDLPAAGEPFSATSEGIGAWIGSNVMIGAFLPVMVVWNYVKNYMGQNKV